jgi:hypothetical protein
MRQRPLRSKAAIFWETSVLTDADCRRLAEQCLVRIAQQCGEDLVLMPHPFETPSTLAYTYQTSEYVATGDVAHALAGNGPILVSKLTGAVEPARTAFPGEDYIREFEAKNVRSV